MAVYPSRAGASGKRTVHRLASQTRRINPLCSAYAIGLLLALRVYTGCQVVREGQTLHFGPTQAPLRTGTIVTVRDAFFKWPVRRKATNEVRIQTNVLRY